MDSIWKALSQAITDWFDGIAADALQFLTETFVVGLGNSGNENTERLSITFNYFKEFLGGDDAFNTIYKMFASGGFYLMLLIFILTMVKRAYAPNDTKDSYADIFFHVTVSVIMIGLAPTILNWAMTAGESIFENAVTKMMGLRTSEWVKGLWHDRIWSPDKNSGGGSAPIIHLIMILVICYNYAKLCIEMVKHYVTMCALSLMSPFAPGFFASADTRNVFFSFWRMFFVEIGVMIINRVWLIITLIMIDRGTVNFVGSCFLIAFMTFGVKLNDIARQLGLSSASLGASLLDSISLTAGAMFHAASGAINVGSKGAIFTGSALNKPGLVGVGQALQGRGVSAASIAGTMRENAGGVLNEKLARRDQNKSNFTPGMGKNISELLRSGSMNDRNAAERQINSLNAAGKKAFYESLTKTQLSGINDTLKKNGMYVSANDFHAVNGIGVELRQLGEDGNPTGKVLATGTVSDNITSGAATFINEDGDKKFLKLENTDNAQLNGEILTFDDNDTLSDYGSVPESVFGMKMTNFVIDDDLNVSGEHSLKDYRLVGAENGTVVQKSDSEGNFHNIGFVDSKGQEYFTGSVMQDINRSNSAQIRDSFKEQFYHQGETIYEKTAEGLPNLNAKTADKEGVFASLGFNNVRDVSFNGDGSKIEFTYDTAGRSNVQGSFTRFTDHMTTAKEAGSQFVQGNNEWGSYYFKEKKSAEPSVSSSSSPSSAVNMTTTTNAVNQTVQNVQTSTTGTAQGNVQSESVQKQTNPEKSVNKKKRNNVPEARVIKKDIKRKKTEE